MPYEKLKELTRGRQVTLDDFARFIDSLSVDEKVKKKLKSLRPKITSASPKGLRNGGNDVYVDYILFHTICLFARISI